MVLIRSVFQEELDGVSQSLVDLTTMVADSMHKATDALINSNLALAEEVISADEKVDNYQHDLDSRIIDIIARQQPVASAGDVSLLEMPYRPSRGADFGSPYLWRIGRCGQ